MYFFFNWLYKEEKKGEKKEGGIVKGEGGMKGYKEMKERG